MGKETTDVNRLSKTLQRGNVEGMKKLMADALETGFSPDRILNEGPVAGMDIVGVQFKNYELFIPEVLVVAKAMHAGFNILKPKPAETGAEPVAKEYADEIGSDGYGVNAADAIDKARELLGQAGNRSKSDESGRRSNFYASALKGGTL